VWTLANLVIYNAPLEWRLFIGNVIDIFWQSIVSDVSADCGGDDETCEIPDDDEEDIVSFKLPEVEMVTTMASTDSSKSNNNDNSNPSVPEPSFYAEKSRIK
jgi:hypothetical protein